ncbi:putative flavoprotein involved in K+ transport [Bradyrhizobium erythrophlei]|jgi:putative flavoprotein involved in K+ transport|nr:putative flavoprotein involved in K+ transport [Bradyrhizobium erythrophlei]
MEQIEVVVIGGGQAGLASSRELTGLGVEHVVLERGQIGETWRNRWDSFCLVTPNWSLRLPGRPYDGTDPDGFMPREQIVAYLEQYAASFGSPVQEHVEISSLSARDGDGFVLETTSGSYKARSLVVATGAYQRPHRPHGANTLPISLLQIDVEDYSNPKALPPGRVLIIGSGQSGCQIAEELHGSGREVVLACGRAPWASRRIGDRDIVWWLAESGFFDAPFSTLPGPEARLYANLLTTGHDGGHDLHLRTLRDAGVILAGHFLGSDGVRARFAPDLEETIAWGDARYRQLMDLFQRLVVQRGLKPIEILKPSPFVGPGPAEIDLAGFGAVIFASGFRPDFRSWLAWPNAFDDDGFPLQVDGASTVIPGLYFVGIHFLRKRKSSLLIGVGEDATIVAHDIARTKSRAT